MFLGRGLGWREAVINSEAEYELILQNETELSDHHPFWVGGSTNVDEETFLAFSEYIPNDAGKIKALQDFLIETDYKTLMTV